jgi:hypothetical protein
VVALLLGGQWEPRLPGTGCRHYVWRASTADQPCLLPACTAASTITVLRDERRRTGGSGTATWVAHATTRPNGGYGFYPWFSTTHAYESDVWNCSEPRSDGALLSQPEPPGGLVGGIFFADKRWSFTVRTWVFRA